MYVLKMLTSRRLLVALVASLGLLLASCGSSDSATTTTSAGAAADDAADDHDDNDHDDEDHGDDDHDGDDHDDSSGGLDAHVHGSAELFVASSGSDLIIDLISPAINIVGFEREPETDEERDVYDERTSTLVEPTMLVVNSDAGCELVDRPIPELIVEASHAEITTTWVFTCANPEQIKQLDATALFEAFPDVEDVDAQWVTEDQSSASELSPSSTILRFE